MRWINKLGRVFEAIPKAIDHKVEAEIEDKTSVAVVAALKAMDTNIPILTALLSGGTVKAEITLRLVDTDKENVK